MLMDHLQAFIFMKEKDRIKIILLFSSMEEDIVAEKIYKRLSKIVTKEVLENLAQQKMFNPLTEIIEEYFHKTQNKTPFFMIGQKYLLFIVMVLSILEAVLILFHTKTEYCILED